MKNPAVETDDVLKKLASESARQGKNLRANVRMLTLKALQRRELTLEQIKGVLENVTVGVTLGVVDREMNVEKALADALAGMDDALLKVVEASKVALERLGGAGQDYEDSYLKQALRDLERFEDAFLQSVAKAADSAGERIGTQWAQVLRKTKLSGTGTGAKAASAVRDYASRAQTALRQQRETGFRAAHLMTQNFATLASGILIGMSEALEAKGAVSKKRATKSKPRKTIKRTTTRARVATKASKASKRPTLKTTRGRKTAGRTRTVKRTKTVKRAKRAKRAATVKGGRAIKPVKRARWHGPITDQGRTHGHRDQIARRAGHPRGAITPRRA